MMMMMMMGVVSQIAGVKAPKAKEDDAEKDDEITKV
jgi:hypothetical protein